MGAFIRLAGESGNEEKTGDLVWNEEDSASLSD
jgi:hypothetical protein